VNGVVLLFDDDERKAKSDSRAKMTTGIEEEVGNEGVKMIFD